MGNELGRSSYYAYGISNGFKWASFNPEPEFELTLTDLTTHSILFTRINSSTSQKIKINLNKSETKPQGSTDLQTNENSDSTQNANKLVYDSIYIDAKDYPGLLQKLDYRFRDSILSQKELLNHLQDYLMATLSIDYYQHVEFLLDEEKKSLKRYHLAIYIPTVADNKDKYYWTAFSDALPDNIVKVSKNYCVIKSFYAKTQSFIPGKLKIDSRNAYIPYGDAEIKCNQFEVLCVKEGARVRWLPYSYGRHPRKGGVDVGDYYIGRAVCPYPENEYTPGKIDLSAEAFFFPWGGKECCEKVYEALIID